MAVQRLSILKLHEHGMPLGGSEEAQWKLESALVYLDGSVKRGASKQSVEAGSEQGVRTMVGLLWIASLWVNR
jgi:hypothetical protein